MLAHFIDEEGDLREAKSLAEGYTARVEDQFEFFLYYYH